MSRSPAAATLETEEAAAPTERTDYNGLRAMRTSPIALEALLAIQDALSASSIDRVTRARIALTVAEANRCDYCLSRHTHLARTMLGLDDTEITANRSGASNDIVADAAVRFAAELVRRRGRVRDEDRAALHGAGFTDGQALEIVALVAMNTWRNYANSVAAPEIDFPNIAARKVA